MSAALETAYRAMERANATDKLAERVQLIAEARDAFEACAAASTGSDVKRHTDNVRMCDERIAALCRALIAGHRTSRDVVIAARRALQE